MNREKWVGYDRNKVLMPHNKKKGPMESSQLKKNSMVGTPISKRDSVELVQIDLVKVVVDNVLNQAHKNFKNYIDHFSSKDKFQAFMDSG